MSRYAFAAIFVLVALAMPVLAGCTKDKDYLCVTPYPNASPIPLRTPEGAGSLRSTGVGKPSITHVVKPTPTAGGHRVGESASVLDAEVNRATNTFGLELLRRLYDDSPGNIMISPVSLAMALGMTANGAVGETQAGILEALALENVGMERANKGYAGLMQTYADPTLPVTLAIANALWLDVATPFHEDYLVDSARFYDAELTTLPMNDVAVDHINAWVSKNTLGEIPTILAKPMSPATVLVLTNAIYLKGRWRAPFDPEQTQDRSFVLLDGGLAEVATMSRTDRLAIVSSGLGDAAYRVTTLPYGEEGNLRVFLILPDAAEGLPDVLASLNAGDLLAWDAALAKASPQRTFLALPKFDSKYEVTLNDTLADMGMERAFSGGADFSTMSPQGARFFVSLVKHKSSVTVDEEGTVAAAASAVVMQKSAAVERQMFVCDHPFAYVIWDGHARTALFVGVIVEP